MRHPQTKWMQTHRFCGCRPPFFLDGRLLQKMVHPQTNWMQTHRFFGCAPSVFLDADFCFFCMRIHLFSGWMLKVFKKQFFRKLFKEKTSIDIRWCRCVGATDV